MADNRLAFEIKSLHISEDSFVLSDSLDGLIGLGEEISPYRRKLKSTYWFHDWNTESDDFSSEGTWVYSKSIREISKENCAAFRVQIRLESGFLPSEIDGVYFFYTLGMHFSNSLKKRKRLGAPAFYGARIEAGSTLVEFYAGAVAIGAAIMAYPKLKAGVLELVADARFLRSAIGKSLANSVEIPLASRKEPTIALSFEVHKQIPYQSQDDPLLIEDLRKNKGGWNV